MGQRCRNNKYSWTSATIVFAISISEVTEPDCLPDSVVLVDLLGYSGLELEAEVQVLVGGHILAIDLLKKLM